jgi:two-component system response regulator AtoC
MIADLPPLISKIAPPTQFDDGFHAAGTLREQVRQFETHLILKTIEEAGGDRRAAAQKLNIGLSSLYRKLEEIEAQPTLHSEHYARLEA